MKNLAENYFGTKFTKFLTDYIFLLLMLVGIAVNFYFEMKVNKAIKKFTANQEIISQYQQYVNQVSQLSKRLDGLESNVRNLALSGQKDFIKNFSTDVKQINQESVIIADNIRPIVSSQNSIELRKSVQQRLALENNLVQIFLQSGTTGIQKKLAADESMKARVKFNLYYSIINAKLQSEIMARNKAQDKDKLEIISLDYAIPHLTSFIFLVIAFFVLYKILQVYKLNKHLNEAVQKEQEAQLLKEQFMDNMTHELRSPLNAVLGYTGLILKTPLKKDQEKFAKAIRTSGELLLNVINEVLDYAKIKSGYLHFANEPFSLKEQLAGLSDIVSDKLSEKGLNYETEIDANVPDNLRGDASKLLQVLLNITFNAIKFTAEGKIKIGVECAEKSEDRVKLKFSVSDTGIGIPAEKLPYIFDRFFQVQDNVAKKYGGTGLGLSITRQIVMLQGGSIHVESEVDKGTTFIFNLVFEIAKNFQASGKNNAESGKQSDGLKAVKKVLPGNMKILIVDDNALNRELACFILKDYSVKFKAAASGQEALDLLKNETFDVVLMDVQMPVLDGRETTRKIREELKLTIPVIALTAFSQPAEKQRCLDAGMDAYLSKPVKEKELFELLEVFAPETLFSENLIDIHYLNGIATDNKEYIDTVILKIAETLPSEIAALRQAVEANDHELVNRLSHDMKTTFAILGLDDSLSEPIRFLESWNSTGKVNGKVKKMMELIESTGEKVIIQIRENFSVDSIKN